MASSVAVATDAGIVEPGDEPADLLAGAIERGFGGDPRRLADFVDILQASVPADTAIALRGSTVMGYAYRDGSAFDAAGPGTSDLDLVLIGDEALQLWVPEARLLGGVNTLPLNDEAHWVAPSLDGPRREAQAIARRPLSIQAMARWFLDLRVVLQAQEYVVLAGPT
jgi:hypothetical protein